jgi:hypothetical protein
MSETFSKVEVITGVAWSGLRTLRKSLFAILENRKDEISPRAAKLVLGLYGDWCGLDQRIEAVSECRLSSLKMVYRGGCGSAWMMSAHPLL